MRSTVEKSVEINVPIGAVYNQWTQFETFPQFMEGVEEVRQIDDKHLHWKAKVGAQTKEWDAEIVEQTPERRISWRSTQGAHNEGVVDFLPMDGGRTKLTAIITYEPDNLMESAGDVLGFMSRRVQGDLVRFRDFIEQLGGDATGAWRGEIHEGRVETTRSDQSVNNT
jgi:uncharacterized membrane protein